jgi:hypothetical protein
MSIFLPMPVSIFYDAKSATTKALCDLNDVMYYPMDVFAVEIQTQV